MIWKRLMFSPAGLPGAPAYVIDKLARIARELSAELSLFDAVYDSDLLATLPPEEPPAALIRQQVEQHRRELETFADMLRAQRLKVHADVRWDYPPYEAIVRYALRHKPDLLIMPTRRAQLTEQRLLSYADHRLIETCPYPLLLLKKREVYSNGTVVAAVDPGHVHAGVAELDERILGAANAVALALGGASVHLCHLLMPEYQLEQEPGGGATRPLGTGRAAEVARLVAMRERLCHLAARHAIPSARVHVRFGRIRDALPALARELRAEIVVMGAVSRSVIGRAIYTQTAEHLLEALGCDVLVVKPSNFRCPISQRAPGLAPLAVTPHGAQRRAAG